MELLFTQSVDPKCSEDSFFHPDVFDFLPFDEYDPDQGKPSASTLRLSGFVTEWMNLHTMMEPYQMDLNNDNQLCDYSSDSFDINHKFF